jgi:hypothetical protein
MTEAQNSSILAVYPTTGTLIVVSPPGSRIRIGDSVEWKGREAHVAW